MGRRWEKAVETLPTSQRIKLARAKMVKVVDHLTHLLSLHANNAIIVYTNKLSAQIPTSYAANAFRDFQHALHRFEVVRICAIWDSADEEKENIATVLSLIDSPAVIDSLCAEIESHWANSGATVLVDDDDPETAEIARAAFILYEADFGRQQAEKARIAISEAIKVARTILASDKLASVMNLRDKSLAHSLEVTRREREGPVQPMKYGYERHLLDTAISVAGPLYTWVNGISMDFENSRRICRDYAEALWDGCTFKVKR